MYHFHSDTRQEELKVQFRQRINDYLERRLAEYPEAEPVRVARHIVMAGGHRWRGLLSIAVGRIFAPAEDALDLCLPGAASVELAHAASMLLDDLPSMDDAILRRGKPCAHRVFPAWAVDLAPALMTSMAYEIALAKTPASAELRVRAALASAEAARQMMLGQQEDLCVLSEPCDERSVMDCYFHKSGSLYACAAKNGAIVAGAADEDVERCYQMGMDLGASYQIMDDIADIEADADALGKNPGMDAGKHTAPVLFGLEEARCRALKLQGRASEALAHYGDEASFARYLVGNSTWAPV